MKKALKFILRMIVTVVIVVGVIYGAMWISGRDKQNTQIVNLSQSLNISTTYKNSYQDIVATVQANNQNTFDDKASDVVVKGAVDVANFLVDYYDHYVVLTSFENSADGNLKQNIVSKIETVDAKIKNTKKLLGQVNSCSPTNFVEKNKRIKNMFAALCDQNNEMFQLCSLLKTYVYKANYQSQVCTSKTEAVFEVAYDFAKKIFETEIVQNINLSKGLAYLSSSVGTDFYKVLALTKTPATHSQIEINFIASYFKIEKTFAGAYFLLNTQQKAEYVQTLANFVTQAPENETTEQAAQRLQNGQNQQKYIQSLHAYLVQA